MPVPPPTDEDMAVDLAREYRLVSDTARVKRPAAVAFRRAMHAEAESARLRAIIARLGKRAADCLEADFGADARPIHEDHRAISSVLAVYGNRKKNP